MKLASPYRTGQAGRLAQVVPVVTVELLRVSAGIAALSGLYYSGSI